MECENSGKASDDDGSEHDVILELSSDRSSINEKGTSLRVEKIEEETNREKDECEITGKGSCDEIKNIDEKLLVNEEIEEAISSEDKEKSDDGDIKKNQLVTNSEAKEEEIQNIVEEEEKGAKEIRRGKAEIEEKMERDNDQILDSKETNTDTEKIETEEAVTQDMVNSARKDIEKMDVEKEIEEDKNTGNKVAIENEKKVTESDKDKLTEGNNKIERKSPEDAREEKKPDVESNEDCMELGEEVKTLKDIESKEKDETMDICEEEETKIEKGTENKEKDEPMDVSEREMKEDNERKQTTVVVNQEEKLDTDTISRADIEEKENTDDISKADKEEKEDKDDISKADRGEKEDTNDISKGEKEEKENTDDICKADREEKEDMNNISKGDNEEKKDTDISKADRGEKEDTNDISKGDKEEKENTDDNSEVDRGEKEDTNDISKGDKEEKEGTDDISKAYKEDTNDTSKADKKGKEDVDTISKADKEEKEDVDTISKADKEEKEVDTISEADKKDVINKLEDKKEKEVDTISESDKKDVLNKPEDKKEQDSEVPKNEKKDSSNKPLGESSEELQMEVEDSNKPTEEIREQINFVDVNAPAAQSPLTIDDDDDDDDIICMDDKGKTNNRPKIRNRSSGNETTSNKRREIVIDLDDDDDDDDIEIETIRTKKKRSRSGGAKGVSCCNIECSSHDQNLQTAPVFVLTYFGRKYKKGRMEKVCDVCFEEAMVHQERLAHMLINRKPLLSAKFPPRNDTVILSDSDEDGVDEDERLPDEVMEYLRDNLQDIMESTMKKYDLDYQIAESTKILSRQLDKLSTGFKETDDTFNQLQRRMDQLRHDIYKDYVPKIKELPPLTIDDSQAGVKEPIIRVASSGMTSNTPQKNQFQFQYRPQQQYPPQKQQSAMQNHLPSFAKQTTPQTQRPNTCSQFPSQSSDALRKSPLAGVATKKVTQIQRSVGPNQPELRQEDVVALEQVQVTHKPLPPIGPITRPKPRLGDVMYVMKLSFYGVWSRAKVMEVAPKGTELSSGNLSMYNVYKVKFESSYRKSNPVKQVTGKQMAYTTPSPVRFPVGTRVIAIFQDNDWSKECYYSGVVAEPPKSMNQYRYLVFFDDGYAQYVSHEKILLVCESSRNVWEDIHPDSREFIRKYLEQYPERPMVKLQQGQIVKTEWNGKWWIARVVEVDGSLVKMHFDADGRTEWIYRGSTRLGPLYAELANAAARKEQGTFGRHRGLGVASLKKRNMPYVEYTRGTEGEELRREDSGEGQQSEAAPVRAVAKKSTTKRPEGLDRGQESPHPVVDKSQQPQGRVEYLQLNTSKHPRKFGPHQCGADCLVGGEYDSKSMKGMNPLVIPLLCAWERQVGRCRGKRVVIYRAPCGRRLRNMEELHRYLRVTKSNMGIDLFDFDFWVHCFAEFVLERGFSNIKDLSYGAEHVPVPCINCVDHSLPDYVSYSTKREPTEGVHLNLDPEFLTGCDCTDDCQDRDKCACWQLTIKGTAFGPGGAVDPTVGYIYRRLPEPVMTGIYECNSRCKCLSTCLNRVAQQPLQLKLQVFKTENRGWGIRCLNDIPQGGFICIYAGRLLTEQGANEGGKNYGDEYLAELDYIEVVEKLKEGYESDVVEDSDSLGEERSYADARRSKAPPQQTPSSQSEEEEEEEAETSQDARDSDEEFQLLPWEKQRTEPEPEPPRGGYRTRLRNRSSRHGSDDSQADKDKDSGMSKDKDVERDSDKDSRRGGRKKTSRSFNSSDHHDSDDDDDESELSVRRPSRFGVVSDPLEDKNKKPKYRSVREFFGLDEYCYIMDAKNNGNIGRYLNHSCSPNVFVQNVFVDTHDVRFPWVAFFALTYIHAGTELTWDYNYDVGSVPEKVLHCYCGSNDCRGRLL